MNDIVSYVLRGCGDTPAQYVLESRARIATFDVDDGWWCLRHKSRKAQSRPLSDWEYDELRPARFNTHFESTAVHWVAGGRL